MPIVINLASDPTSPHRGSGDSGLARSSAGQILIRSFDRYLKGEISGRSVLVAGHRGAGKSTLVDLALREVATAGSRPLRVSLYGPSLFPRYRQGADPDASQGVDGEEGAGRANSSGSDRLPKSDPKPSDVQRLLMELTVALYRSLAKEIVASFERTLANADPATLPSRYAEIPSQLVLELDEAPGPDRLRHFWEALRRSGQGVLFQASKDRPASQGARELVALASAAQAFRIVAGRIDLSEESSRKAERTWSDSVETKMDLKAILGAFLALCSGLFGAAAALLVGQAAAVQTETASLGWLGAAVAAVWAALSANRTAKATSGRGTTQARTYKFIRDYKVDTLARELPNLIERVRQAGLAPIFVVDELDKVPDLAKNLHGLVQELKPLVAEQTFFCFVSDRDYFEHLRVQGREAPYAPEHTYFTHRLYVSYSPKNLRDFLIRTIGVKQDPQENLGMLEIEQRALACVMLFHARLQPFELSRQIQDVAASTGDRSLLRSGTTRTDAGSRYAIAYQLTIEAILLEEELDSRMAKDAYFRQVVYDALYFPAEIWQRGLRNFELNADTLRSHLAARMNPDIPCFRSQQQNDTNDGAEPKFDRSISEPQSFDRILGGHDLIFLLARVEELVGYLALPRRLKSSLKLGGFDVDVVNLISDAPLAIKVGESIQFSCDYFGRPYARLTQAQQDKFSRMGPQLMELDRKIRSITVTSGSQLGLDAFADRYRILPGSPAWQVIAPSLQRFTNSGADRMPDDASKDALAIVGFGEGLLERSHVLALAFSCARRLVSLTGANHDSCFSALSRLAKVSGREIGTMETNLRAVCVKLDVEIPGYSEDPLKTLPDCLMAETVASLDRSTINDKRSELWFRVLTVVRTNAFPAPNLWRPDFADLICAAAMASPVSLLQSVLAEMSIAEWTTVLRLALEGLPLDDPSYVPSWMEVVALEYLGLGRASVEIELPLPPKEVISISSSDDTVDRNDLIARLKKRPQGIVPDHLVIVIAKPGSRALRWLVGNRIVGLVTTVDDAPATFSALERLHFLAGSDKPRITPLVLSEVGNDAAVQATSISAFADAPVRQLFWDPAESSSLASEELVVFGTEEIDQLTPSLGERTLQHVDATGASDQP